jgi:type IV pilus assembly protein PilO
MNPRVEWILKRPAYQRTLLLLALCGGILAAFVFLVILPQKEEYESLLKRNQGLLTKLEDDRRIAANLPKFKAEYEKMQLQLDQALTELPNEREIPALLTSIATLAKDNGLDVLRFKPGNEAPKGFYAEVPVDLKLVGSFHQIASFFFAVGDLPRIVNIGSVTMAGPKKVGGTTMLSVDCLATTFRFIEAAAAPAKAPAKGKK